MTAPARHLTVVGDAPAGPRPLDRLTEREWQVLDLLASGRSNSAIGHALYLSPKTVEAHVRSVFSKLDLKQRPDEHRRVMATVAYFNHRDERPVRAVPPAMSPNTLTDERRRTAR
jgi:DNA-binding NarL/FixJ family response regulator